MTHDEWKAECERQALRREGYLRARNESVLTSYVGKYERAAMVQFPDPPKPTVRRVVRWRGMQYKLDDAGEWVLCRRSVTEEWLPDLSSDRAMMAANLIQNPNEPEP